MLTHIEIRSGDRSLSGEPAPNMIERVHRYVTLLLLPASHEQSAEPSASWFTERDGGDDLRELNRSRGPSGLRAQRLYELLDLG